MSDAKHIAKKRGEVWNFRHEPAMICNVIICIAGLVAHVRIRRVERIRITLKRLEREAVEDPEALRFIVSSPEITGKLRVSPP